MYGDTYAVGRIGEAYAATRSTRLELEQSQPENSKRKVVRSFAASTGRGTSKHLSSIIYWLECSLMALCGPYRYSFSRVHEVAVQIEVRSRGREPVTALLTKDLVACSL